MNDDLLLAALETAEQLRSEGHSRREVLRRLAEQYPPEVLVELRQVLECGDAMASSGSLGGAPSVDGYRITHRLAEGGEGTIYQGVRLSDGRPVALKVMRGDRTSHVRFRREADWLADLGRRYPGDDCPVVEFIESPKNQRESVIVLALAGPSLQAEQDRRQLPPNQAAGIVRQLAIQTQKCHEAGILHRDLKPSNAVRAANGDWKLIDFGRACAIDRPASAVEPGQTADHEMVGTPEYMAPEQAGDNHAGICRATDVYALGAILYELLTAQPPFHRAATDKQTRERLREREPTPPRKLNPAVPDALDQICQVCLCKRPEDRYQTPAELAADLFRFSKGERPHRWPPGVVKRGLRWANSHRSLVAVFVLLFALVCVIGVSGWFYQSEQQRQIATADRAERDGETLLAEAEGIADSSASTPLDSLIGERALARITQAIQRVEEYRPQSPVCSRAREQAERIHERMRLAREIAEEEARDRRFAAKLQQIRVVRTQTPGKKVEFWRSDEGYSQLFAEEYGFFPGSDPLTNEARNHLAERLKRRPNRSKIVAALLDWQICHMGSVVERFRFFQLGSAFATCRQIRELAQAVDIDTDWHRRLYIGISHPEAAFNMRNLAREMNPEAESAELVAFMANFLVDVNQFADARELLSRAHRVHGNDYWVNQLMVMAIMSDAPADTTEGLRYASMALNAAPDSPFAHGIIAEVFRRANRQEEAKYHSDKADELAKRLCTK